MSVTLSFSKSHNARAVSEVSSEHPGQPLAEVASLMDGRRQNCMGSFMGLTSLLSEGPWVAVSVVALLPKALRTEQSEKA